MSSGRRESVGQRVLDPSFLDGKLQQALNKSYTVQSQLKFTVTKSEPPPSHSRQTKGKTRRSNAIERMVDRSSTVLLGKLLLESEVNKVVRQFLGPHLHRVLLMLTTKIIRMRPIIPSSHQSVSLDESSAANMFKENMLYAAPPAKSIQQEERLVNTIPDLTDTEKLRHEIHELETQKARLIKDSARCQTFLYHSRTSDSLIYFYYAERLHFARRCYDQTKIRPMSGNYLSRMFDLKCQQLKGAEDMVNTLTIANNIINTISFNLVHEVDAIVELLLANDQDEYKALEQELEASFQQRLAALYEEEYAKVRLLDDQLVKTIQQIKYIQNMSSSVELTKQVKLQSQAITDSDKRASAQQPHQRDRDAQGQQGINYEELFNKEVLQMQKHERSMHKDARDCMERCFLMASKRAYNKRMAMQAILDGRFTSSTSKVDDFPRAEVLNQRMKDQVQDVAEDCKYHQNLVSKENKAGITLRESVFAQHHERMNGLQDLLTQQRNTYMSQLKAKMGTLYTATQSRSKRHSFAFQG